MRIPTGRLIVCLAAAGLVASCASSAAPGVSTIDKSFLGGIGSYDQNKDNVVTCDEWRTAAANLFTRANKSGSGVLSEDEFGNLVAIDRTFLVASFKYYDANGDAKVEKAEFVERPNPAFNLADADKDCRLTDLEQLTARNKSAPPKSETAHSRATTGGPASGIPSAAPGGRTY